MDFTINCTRVPSLYGVPVEVGPARAPLGSVSTHDATYGEPYDEPYEHYMIPTLLGEHFLIEKGQLQRITN